MDSSLSSLGLVILERIDLSCFSPIEKVMMVKMLWEELIETTNNQKNPEEYKELNELTRITIGFLDELILFKKGVSVN